MGHGVKHKSLVSSGKFKQPLNTYKNMFRELKGWMEEKNKLYNFY
jgi:hypothetical protein